MRSLEFDPAGFEDLGWWVRHDRKKALHVIGLIEDIQRDPFSGIGKPEPLKHELQAAGRDALTSSTGWFTRSRAKRFASWRAGITIEIDMHGKCFLEGRRNIN